MPFKPGDPPAEDVTGPNPGELELKPLAETPGELGATDIITPAMQDNLMARGILKPTDWSQYPAGPELAGRDQGAVKGMLPAISQKLGRKVGIEEVLDANPANGKWVLKDGSTHMRYGTVS